MSEPHTIRCTGKHPRRAGRCNERLAVVYPDTVVVDRSADPQPGCALIVCPCCGTRWRICARDAPPSTASAA